MQITVSVVIVDIGNGINMYKPDYSGRYKVVSYSKDKTTCIIEVQS